MTATPSSPARATAPEPVTYGRLLDFPDDPVACMRRLYRAHGNLAALEEDGQRLVFVFGPEYNQRVLSDTQTFHARFFALRGPRHSAQRRLTSGLLSMNGEEHKRHRRLVMGPFQKKSIAAYRDGLVGLAEDMVGEWKTGQVRDIFRDMTRYMLRVTSHLLFGFDRSDLAYQIGLGIERWVARNHELGMGALIADPEITQSYHRLLEEAEALELLIREMIAFRRASAAPGNDVLSLLIQARDENGAGMTDTELIGQAAVLFGAAHLTTANSLTWTLFLLAQHPEVAAALDAEVTASLGGAAPTLEQLEQLPVLDRVIKESMRVLPASSYSQRVTAAPVDLGPLHLPRNTVVIFSQFISHHIPDLFPDPEHFRPERWLTLAPPPYAYLPFAAGPRLCLGAALAMMTIKTTLPIILQRHHLSVVPGARINGKVISTMLTPTSGMPMLVQPPTAPFVSSYVEGNIHDLMVLEPGTDRAGSRPRAA
jgi:cytochrome P450